ncbi:Histone-lysine_N-methyltransferase SETD1 [Hexamita inflata]|uniref:Histone-lysine N-methyltransferase SETD1 n=1 Tax=Hexamita inflata TaxID=28002 RepID=A0AA86TXR9_9EUKA|nr:Histone-lysine N-methyltransferase SETD1 [Hexamita inflata]
MQFFNLEEIGFKTPTQTTVLTPEVEEQDYKLNMSLQTIRDLNAKKLRDCQKLIVSREKKQSHNIQVIHYAQKPSTIVQRSSIHGFGLFASKLIKQGEQIIEYQGQKIDSLLNDLVENTYQQNGFESTYMFRMGNTPHVIDATFIGNGARFANHSCSPNATSKLIGSKVFLIALQNIDIGEEIVYNYNMRRIEGLPRVVCYCGFDNCNGYMDNVK